TTANAIGKTGASSYTLTDLWTGATSTTTSTISASVPGHGTVMFRVAGGSTPPPPPGGEIHAVGAGKCLDVPNSTTTGGTQLQINTCAGGSNQIFSRTSTGALSVYSGSSQMCLDANAKGTTNGTKVIIWTCNGQTNQQWNVNSNGTITGVASGLCLDVTGASTANGALVELWACNGGSNQQWTIS
ncbi:MAG: RICIN domain-containing protein, partial [Catenulisporales bacterium]|nr:RICIN domain-containing protein [Catenulisporales bacterium]